MEYAFTRIGTLAVAAALVIACGAPESTPEPGSAPATDGAGLEMVTGGSEALEPTAVLNSSTDTLDVYRLPTCGCCGNWAEHMQEAGFVVRIHDLPDMSEAKAAVGVPTDLQSCHTGVVGGYVIEGHVPADAVKRLLAEGPEAAGIAVPGMPIGSPGMEVPGQAADEYEIILFGKDGSRTVFEKR